MIHSVDDPMVPAISIPKAHEISDAVTFERSAYGGHVGFISGSLAQPVFWLEKRIMDYFSGDYLRYNYLVTDENGPLLENSIC